MSDSVLRGQKYFVGDFHLAQRSYPPFHVVESYRKVKTVPTKAKDRKGTGGVTRSNKQNSQKKVYL